MPYTLGTAAKATGKSKPTIQRAIKSGRISAVRKDDGSYEIDPSELHRVYPPLHDTGNDTRDAVTPSETPLQAEISRLREHSNTIEAERERERGQLLDQIADLRARLDAEAEERRRVTALLTREHQPPAPARRRRSWWPWSRMS